MDNIKQLTKHNLTETEVIIFFLVENSGANFRTLGDWLQLSHENVRKTYERAKKKMDKLAEAGFFSTDIKS